MIRTKHDGVGRWFTWLRKRAESDSIWIGTLRPGELEPRWTALPHGESDGVGALVRCLREAGCGERLSIPTLKDSSSPSRLKLVGLLISYLMKLFRTKRPNRLRASAEGRATAKLQLRSGKDLFWHVFSPAETDELQRRAQRLGITLNSYLLSQLDRATRELTERPQAAIAWMIPINMRGAVAMESEVMNHVSYLQIEIESDDTPRNIHRKVERAMKRNWHWFFWHWCQVTSLVGPRVGLWLLRLQELGNQCWVGAFSNLGRWTLDSQAPQAEGTAWLFCPPVTRFHPLGVGSVTVHGRLAITVQVHPDYVRSQDIARSILQSFLAIIGSSPISVGNRIRSSSSAISLRCVKPENAGDFRAH